MTEGDAPDSTSPRVCWIPFATDGRSGSSQYRCLTPALTIEREGGVSFVENAPDARSLLDRGLDIAVFQKRYTASDVRLTQNLKSLGVKICFDLCDNHIYLLESVGDLERRQLLQMMIDLADVVTVPTPTLRAAVARSSVVVVDDAVEPPDGLGRLETRRWGRRGRLRVVWFGSAGARQPQFGLPDLAAAIGSLERLNERRPLRLDVISNDRRLYAELIRTNRFPHRYYDWSLVRSHRRIAAADLCVLPTNRNPFTLGKSANRAVLALLLGTGVAATPLPAYDELDAYVAVGEEIDVVAEGLAADPVATSERVRRAAVDLPTRFSASAVASQWRDVFSSIA